MTTDRDAALRDVQTEIRSYLDNDEVPSLLVMQMWHDHISAALLTPPTEGVMDDWHAKRTDNSWVLASPSGDVCEAMDRDHSPFAEVIRQVSQSIAAAPKQKEQP